MILYPGLNIILILHQKNRREVARQDCHMSVVHPEYASEASLSLSPGDSLLAWIDRCGNGDFVGAFVGEGAAPGAIPDFPGRAPATRRCFSPDEARHWIEQEAAAFGVPIKWVNHC